MTTHSMWLAGSLAMGARGLISGAGSVVADRQSELFDAMAGGTGTIPAAKITQMHHLVEAFYGHPYVDWQARMKELLYRFGRIKTPVARAPLQRISNNDWQRMLPHLEAAKLTAETLYRGS